METTQPFVNEPIEVGNLPQLADDAFLPLHREYLYVRLVAGFIFFAFLAVAGGILYRSTDFTIAEIFVPWLVLLLVNLALQLLGFPKKGYQMREHDISYKRGLVFHKRTTVPLVRIQHSEVSQGPLERLFDLSTVKIFTAGGQTSDISIPGLSPDEAARVRDYINKMVRENAGE